MTIDLLYEKTVSPHIARVWNIQLNSLSSILDNFHLLSIFRRTKRRWMDRIALWLYAYTGKDVVFFLWVNKSYPGFSSRILCLEGANKSFAGGKIIRCSESVFCLWWLRALHLFTHHNRKTRFIPIKFYHSLLSNLHLKSRSIHRFHDALHFMKKRRRKRKYWKLYHIHLTLNVSDAVP